MLGPRAKRAPAWSEREVLALLGLWGKDAVQARLRSNRRNLVVYEQISRAMVERGFHRDVQQCRAKAKELRQAYLKVREANARAGAAPQTCRFYTELHAILGDHPTPATTSRQEEPEAPAAGAWKEERLDEDEEAATGKAGILENRELFAGQAPLRCSGAAQDAGEGTSAFAGGSAAEGPFPGGRGPKRRRDDAPPDGLAEAVSRLWEKPAPARAEDQDRRTQREMLGLLREQTDILRCLLEMMEKYLKSRVPLQPLQNSSPAPAGFPTPPHTLSPWRRAPAHHPFRASPGEAARIHRRPFTDA